MRLIESSVEEYKQAPGLQGVYEQIERCGKTCYKSEPKGGETAKSFVDRMIENGHTAMLEHGTVYLKFPLTRETEFIRQFYINNKYSTCIWRIEQGMPKMDSITQWVYVTTNYRVIVEGAREEDLGFICEPTRYHARRITYKIICDRGVSHELVRHRSFSFAQESQRYCNYSKDKFGKELTFISPVKDMTPDEYKVWRHALSTAEESYFKLIDLGFKPQEARSVLPNSTKTEIIVTGFKTDWDAFFDLRYFETTGPAHPDMKRVATLIYNEEINKK